MRERTSALRETNEALRREIAVRQQAEDALRTSEERYRTLVETNAAVVWRANAGGELIAGQLSWKDFTGQPGEPDFSTWLQMVHPDDRERLLSAWSVAQSEGRFEMAGAGVWHEKSQAYRHCVIRAAAVRNPDGSRREWIGTIADIDDQVRAREELARTRALLESAFSCSAAGILVTDAPEGRLRWMNAAAERILGCQNSEFVGLLLEEVNSKLNIYAADGMPLSPDQRPLALALREGVVSENTELIVQGSGDRAQWVLASAAPVRDESGSMVAATLVLSDITQRRYAEMLLQESEHRYRTLFETGADAFLVLDGEGSILDCNGRAEKLFGCSREKLVGRHPAIFSPPLQAGGADSRATLDGHIQDALAGGPKLFDWRHIRADGTPFETEINFSPLRLSSGTYVTGSIRDVTARKSAQEQLQKSRRRLATLMASLPGMAYRWRNDNPWFIEFVSDGCVDLLGYRADELIGNRLTSYEEMIHPADRARVREAVTHAIEQTWSFEIEYRIRAADGTEKWVWERGAAVEHPEDGPAVIEGFVSDVTARRSAEEARRASEERFKVLFEDAPVGYVLATTDGVIRDVNNHLLALSGCSRNKLVGKRLDTCGLREATTGAAVSQLVEVVARVGGTASAEFELPQSNNGSRDVELTVQKAEIHGAPYILGCARDVTKRKEAERQLAILNKELGLRLEDISKLKALTETENVQLKEVIRVQQPSPGIVGESPAMRKLAVDLEQVARSNTTVLVLGETGTGKELAARAIHQLSNRKDRPLVTVNCAALSPTLIESELFGHEKGAFTGAATRKLGRFELANHGTIFLDEIGDLPRDLQAKLLRVLQEGELERVGGTQTIRVDVRIIAATNRDLEEATNAGTFRKDLYYRLNVFPLVVPPLRDRPGDIPLLAAHFLVRFSQQLGKRISDFSGRAMELLKQHDWPGNIRELEHVVERAAISAPGPLIDAEHVTIQRAAPGVDDPEKLDDVERHHLLRILEKSDWVIDGPNGAAARVGLHPSTFRYRMQKLNIDRRQRAANA